MTVFNVLIGLTVIVLVVSALLALFRLAKGPTGLDRGVASDVIIAILIAGICTYTVWSHTPVALVIILLLTLVGFTTAVGLARLITGSSARERRFLEGEARAAYAEEERRAQGRDA